MLDLFTTSVKGHEALCHLSYSLEGNFVIYGRGIVSLHGYYGPSTLRTHYFKLCVFYSVLLSSLFM